MLRVNSTLKILDLEVIFREKRNLILNLIFFCFQDNKIDSDGIQAIAAALKDNTGLIELTLFKNREPGERVI